MDNKTYEALKNIIAFVKGNKKPLKNNDIKQVEDWIDETAKEHKN